MKQLVILAPLLFSLIGCANVHYEGHSKQYRTAMFQEEFHSAQPRMIAYKPNPKEFGHMYIDRQNGESLTFDIKHDKRMYKANTPLIKRHNKRITDFSISSEKGRSLLAGFEIYLPLFD